MPQELLWIPYTPDDPSTDYKALAKESGEKFLLCAARARILHRNTAVFHARLGKGRHREAMRAHIHKADEFGRHMSEKLVDPNSLSNKDASSVYNDIQRRLAECELSAADAERNFYHLHNGRGQEALDGAPYPLPNISNLHI